MNVSVLQVDRYKLILGLDAFDNAPARQHLERELVQSPVQDSPIQDWLLTTFLGYDEVRAVKPLPHLGWRDWLDCILCQEDSNLLAQDWHRRLENAVELGRSPGELNRVAESNCAREPARQAGQREPRLQTLCKWLQRHNRRTGGGAAKGSRGGWYRRRCVLRHPHRTPWVPNGTGQRCVGRYVVPELYSLGCWQKWVVGESEEAGHRALSSHGPENPEEKEIALSLSKWVPLPLGPVAEQNKTKHRILLPALHRGKEWRCSCHLLRKSKL